MSRIMAAAGRRRRRTRRTRGAGFFDFVKKAANWVKDNKLISRGLKLIPHPAARAGAAAAGALGLGRRRRRTYRRRRVGGSLASVLKKAHGFIKERRLVSGALRHFGHTSLANAAHKLGYGKRRRRTRRRRVQGGSLGGVLKKAHAFIKQRRVVSGALKAFGHTKLASAAHALGYGRRRKRRTRRVGRGSALGAAVPGAYYEQPAAPRF